MANRSYNQHCGLSYALDVVGERWTLLIIRELFAGPRRFTDLLEGLPGISTNLLTERLKRLEEQGVLQRRILPPPAASIVYELTAVGQGLEPALLELGHWGSQFVPDAVEPEHLLHFGSYALTPKTFFRPALAQGLDKTYALHVGGEVQQVRISNGAYELVQGEAGPADVVLYADVPIYMGLLSGEIALEDALASGLLRVDGDLDALRRFLEICRIEKPTYV